MVTNIRSPPQIAMYNMNRCRLSSFKYPPQVVPDSYARFQTQRRRRKIRCKTTSQFWAADGHEETGDPYQTQIGFGEGKGAKIDEI